MTVNLCQRQWVGVFILGMAIQGRAGPDHGCPIPTPSHLRNGEKARGDAGLGQIKLYFTNLNEIDEIKMKYKRKTLIYIK